MVGDLSGKNQEGQRWDQSWNTKQDVSCWGAGQIMSHWFGEFEDWRLDDNCDAGATLIQIALLNELRNNAVEDRHIPRAIQHPTL